MSEKKTTSVVIDDKPYVYEEMSPQQQTMVNHISDLDRKIATARFNLDQLQVGKDAFVNMLKADLEKPKTE
jgi:hypothetical protein